MAKFSEIVKSLAPYRGVIRFALVLVVAHFTWKFTVLGDEGSEMVTFFGCDISAPFTWMCNHIAEVVYATLRGFGYEMSLCDGTILRFANGRGAHIVWACSGIKQAFIFCCILLFARGPWQHKLWFVPLGVVACYVVNLARLVLLTAVLYNHPAWFDVMHDHIIKYAFYLIIFMLWVWWEEKFNTSR